MSDDPLTECPECGGELKRIITSVGIIFKGSGFHVNDYKAKSPTAAPASSDKDSKSEKSEPAKAEPAKSEPEKPATQDKAVA